jgi:hypothetical protein
MLLGLRRSEGDFNTRDPNPARNSRSWRRFAAGGSAGAGARRSGSRTVTPGWRTAGVRACPGPGRRGQPRRGPVPPIPDNTTAGGRVRRTTWMRTGAAADVGRGGKTRRRVGARGGEPPAGEASAPEVWPKSRLPAERRRVLGGFGKDWGCDACFHRCMIGPLCGVLGCAAARI